MPQDATNPEACSLLGGKNISSIAQTRQAAQAQMLAARADAKDIQ
jgi:hypothetical protein